MAVNLSPVGGVAAQFFTSTGAVLTGGKLYTYAAGTTTPATTYTTSQGNVAWSNPVVLDAAGRVSGSGEIWLLDGAIYKFVLKDSNDVLIATYDNITGINSNAVAYTNQQEIVTATAGQTVFNLGISYQPGTNSLSVFVDGVNQYGPGVQYSYVETDGNTVTFNSGLHVGAEVKFTTTQQQGAGLADASQITYDPPWVSSVIRSSAAKMSDWLSLADFIPVGTDTTTVDCAPYLQAAIDAEGGSVFIPKGVYRMASQVVLPVNNFYTLTPGNQIFSQGAELVVETTTPLFTQNVGTDYTAKWFFHDLSFTSSTPNSKVFDMDRIYNSIFMNNVFVGIGSVFYSRVDRSGSPSYPDGYIQSAYITNNHFASCDKGVDAKRAFNLDVSNNYFEACGNPVAVDGNGDPACNQIRITNNVMEGGSGTPIILGGVFGGLIQGNYFEANSGAPTCDIKLDVAGASFHRGLVISANSFQPTAGQKADAGWSNIKIDKVISAGRGPVVTGNTTSGPRLIDGLDSNEMALLSGNYESIGTNITDKYPIPGQTSVKFASIRTGFLNNRATAYNGAGVWKVLTIDDIIQSTVYDFNGYLNLYNVGGNLLGVTQVSMKFRVFIDAQGVLTAAMVGTLQLEEMTGARNVGGDPLYAAYWGAVAPTFTVSGSSVTVVFDTFNDHSVSGLGEVYSLGPSFSVVVSTGDPIYSPTNFSMP